MDRLSLVLSILTGAVVTGVLTVIALASGWYGWTPILAAAIIGFSASWPAAFAISRRIKREDPHFDHRRIDATERRLPEPGAREV